MGRKKRRITLELFGTRSSHRHGAFHERKAPVLRFFLHKCTTMSCSADLCCRKSCCSWLTRPLFKTCKQSVCNTPLQRIRRCVRYIHGLSPTAPPPPRSGAYRVFTRKPYLLVKRSETPSVRPSARASICARTVEELLDRPQELVAYILQSDPQAGTKKIPSCQKRQGANRHDD